MSPRRQFTDLEKKLIEEHRRTLTDRQIAQALNCSRTMVRNYLIASRKEKTRTGRDHQLRKFAATLGLPHAAAGVWKYGAREFVRMYLNSLENGKKENHRKERPEG